MTNTKKSTVIRSECTGVENCDSCQRLYNMPYSYCCFDECGEHPYCVGCGHGIYKNDSKEMKEERLKESQGG